MFCSGCGNNLARENGDFCPNCGTKKAMDFSPYGYGGVPKTGGGKATASLVLGIKGMRTHKRDRAIAGVVLCIIGLVATIVNSAIGAFLGAIGVLF